MVVVDYATILMTLRGAMIIFISYRMSESALVRERLYAPLVGAGLGDSVWMADEHQHGEASTSVSRVLAETLSQTSVLLVAGTQKLLDKKNWCWSEIKQIADRQMNAQDDFGPQALVAELEPGLERFFTGGDPNNPAVPPYLLLNDSMRYALYGDHAILASVQQAFIRKVRSAWLHSVPRLDALNDVTLLALQREILERFHLTSPMPLPFPSDLGGDYLLVPPIKARLAHGTEVKATAPFLVSARPVCRGASGRQTGIIFSRTGAIALSGHLYVKPRLPTGEEALVARNYLSDGALAGISHLLIRSSVLNKARLLRLADGNEGEFALRVAQPDYATLAVCQLPVLP